MPSQPTVARPVVVDADASWQTDGAALRADLHAALAPHATRVEHIGSTSIPGMAAKPVLDLQASVTDLAAIDEPFDVVLTGLGFRRSPWRADHVPAGHTDPPERWAKRLWLRRGRAGLDVNLHVRLVGSPNERLALLFRDWFRAHPATVPGYARFKRVLADAVPDLDVYTDVKDPVVDVVVAVAEDWAAETGWTA